MCFLSLNIDISGNILIVFHILHYYVQNSTVFHTIVSVRQTKTTIDHWIETNHQYFHITFCFVIPIEVRQHYFKMKKKLPF